MLNVSESQETKSHNKASNLVEELVLATNLASEIYKNCLDRHSSELMTSYLIQEKIDLLSVSISFLSQELSDPSTLESLPHNNELELRNFSNSVFFLAGTLDVYKGAKLALKGSKSNTNAQYSLDQISKLIEPNVKSAISTFSPIATKIKESIELSNI